jgi:endonuclease YncB( thermonuclease family)
MRQLLIFFFCLNCLAGTATKWTVIKNCKFLDTEYFDADSFHIMCDGNEKIFRLYFVDAPETDYRFGRIYKQSEYFETADEYVLEIGKEATRYVSTLLTNSLTIYTKWRGCGGQSRLKRYYAVVKVDGTDLAEMLVENGYARVFGTKTRYPDGEFAKDVQARLELLEKQARTNRVGVWKFRADGLPQLR